MSRIAGYRGYPPKKVFRVIKWHQAVKAAMDDLSKKHHEFLREFAELDEGGNFVPQDGKVGTFILSKDTQDDQEKMKEYWAKNEEFNKIEVQVQCNPLSYFEIAKVGLSPEEVDSLGDLISIGE